MQAQDVLPDHINHRDYGGVMIRKGTVAAFLNNARTWLAPDSTPASRAGAEADLVAALPALEALGLFDILAIADPALRAFIATRCAAPAPRC
ncbi:MAG TPA: hypothetical protein VFF16_09825 [Telluria sp.]|nr:hypothetical protein [Telluria sp.]